MSSSRSKVTFKSSLAPLMEQFVREKRAVGYKYESGAAVLVHLDRFLADQAPEHGGMSRSTLRKWLAKDPQEHPRTQHARFGAARQFAEFLCRHGHPAYVPDASLWAKGGASYQPRIFTHAEVRQLLQEADRMGPSAWSPFRHLVMPEVFRLLYGCGFRIGEVVKLRIDDVDLNRGVLIVRDGKFGKDRLVPPVLPLVERLRSYDAAVSAVVGARPGDAFFFPSVHGGPYRIGAIYVAFRRLLYRCGIPHGGRGKGPRVHDLRHTFAVHAMLRWYREGADLDAKLPVLATYLGHRSLLGTERYLHLTAELFPEVAVRVNAAFGDVIPPGSAP